MIVDHIIIVGNRRISTRTIERELQLREGEPLGYSALVESRARLFALGMFRRAQIEPLGHGGEARRDVLVEVEESPPTELGFGGGLEGGSYVVSGDNVARNARGCTARLLSVGRRNLWGKNRRIDLFTRLAVRRRDPPAVAVPAPSPPEGPLVDPLRSSGVASTVSSARPVSRAKGIRLACRCRCHGLVEQARRSSFNFTGEARRSGVPARGSHRHRTLLVSAHPAVRRALHPDAPPPLIDRLFPGAALQVSASSSATVTTRSIHGDDDRRWRDRSTRSISGFSRRTQGFYYTVCRHGVVR